MNKIIIILTFNILINASINMYAQLPNPGTTIINYDYGPRNVSSGSFFHKGIDYRIKDTTPGLSVESGIISEITMIGDNSYIKIGDWLYRHILYQNSDATWDMQYVGTYQYPYIFIREISNKIYITKKVLGVLGCPSSIVDPVTQTTKSVTTNIIVGDIVFYARDYIPYNTTEGDHLHLESVPSSTNPLSEVTYPNLGTGYIAPTVSTNVKLVVNNALVTNPTKYYGNILIEADASANYDLNVVDIQYKIGNGTYTSLKRWQYAGNGHNVVAEEVFPVSESLIPDCYYTGIFPYPTRQSRDMCKYVWNTCPTYRITPDGKYKFRTTVTDIRNRSNTTTNEKEIIIDNTPSNINTLKMFAPSGSPKTDQLYKVLPIGWTENVVK